MQSLSSKGTRVAQTVVTHFIDIEAHALAARESLILHTAAVLSSPQPAASEEEDEEKQLDIIHTVPIKARYNFASNPQEAEQGFVQVTIPLPLHTFIACDDNIIVSAAELELGFGVGFDSPSVLAFNVPVGNVNLHAFPVWIGTALVIGLLTFWILQETKHMFIVE